MPGDYVKRSDTLQAVGDIHPLDYNGQGIVERIKAIPAADVVERKVGHWIFHPEQKNIYGGKLIECSECRTQYLVMNVLEEIYCRHCGSKNRNGGRDE
mgnify:CR=1 FL=1